MRDRRVPLFLVGDALIALPWSHVGRPRFLEPVAMTRRAERDDRQSQDRHLRL